MDGNNRGWELAVLKGGEKVRRLVTLAERQAFCDYIAREKKRHLRDIKQIDHDLERFARIGVLPRDMDVDEWIEVEE